MAPIFNITDNWKQLYISLKKSSLIENNWWYNLYIKKEHIKRDYPDEFADLKQFIT
jgi:hypothetical protein